MSDRAVCGIYGEVPADLAEAPADAVQFSPLQPGAASLEAQPAASLAGFVCLAPGGTIERRYVLAQMLRSLQPGAPFTVLAPKDRGGARLAGELEGFGCVVAQDARRHHRLCTGRRPDEIVGLDTALAEGSPQFLEPLGLFTQPGVFSWDRLDPASALLIPHIAGLSGRGADFGCGIGSLAWAVLRSPHVEQLVLIDIDRRAVDAARRNIEDTRADIRWADLRQPGLVPSRLDFIVMNPPFHDSGIEDKNLGQSFIRLAAAALRPGGRLWLTANRHLPYEAVMKPLFKRVTPLVEDGGYKVFEAQK